MIKIKPMLISEILALTGQIHDDDFEYDKIITIYVGGMRYLDMLKEISAGDLCADPIVAAVLGLNLEEKRVVDIAVHPYFRKLGFGKAIVELAVKEYDVEIAYTVEPEAEKFWKAIGWCYVGSELDKGVLVKVWRRLEGITDEFLDSIPLKDDLTSRPFSDILKEMKSEESDEKLIRWKCPRCGLLGNIDDEQRLGKVSIICPEDEGGCGWHGHMGDPA